MSLHGASPLRVRIALRLAAQNCLSHAGQGSRRDSATAFHSHGCLWAIPGRLLEDVSCSPNCSQVGGACVGAGSYPFT